MFLKSLAIGARPLTVLAVLAVGACQSPDRVITMDDPEEAEDFQRSLDQYATSVDGLLQEAQKGKNVSSFSLGMLSYNILVTVSASDKNLRDYFNADGQDVQDYLKTRFQDHPEQEIAALDRMKDGSALRTSARYTLEALTHLPNSGDSPAAQQRCREALAVALKHTENSLIQAASEVRVQY